MNVPGLGKETVGEFIAERTEACEYAKEQISKIPDDTSIVTYFDEGYPSDLKATYSPPPLLYIRGNAGLIKV